MALNSPDNRWLGLNHDNDTNRVIYNLKRLTPLSLVTTATPDVSLRIRQTTKIVFIIMLAIELTAFPSSPPQNGRGMRWVIG